MVSCIVQLQYWWIFVSFNNFLWLSGAYTVFFLKRFFNPLVPNIHQLLHTLGVKMPSQLLPVTCNVMEAI